MEAINIFLLILSIATFGLSLFILFKSKRKVFDLSFSALVAIGGIWSLSIALFREASTLASALFWNRIIYVSATLIAPVLLIFAYSFIENKFKLKLWRFCVYFLPIAILMPVLFLTNFWIKNIILNDAGNSVELGLVYPVWVACFAIYMIWSFILLLIKYKKSNGLIKLQLRYILLSLAFPVIGSVPFNVISPLLGHYSLIWIGPIFMLAMMIIIAYAILKYRLMDIRVAVRRSIVYLIIAAFVYGFYHLITWLFIKSFHSLYSAKALISGAFVAILFVVLLFLFEKLIRRFTNKFIFGELYSKHKSLENLTKKITTIIDLDKLAKTAAKVISKSVGTDKIAIALKDSESETDYKFIQLGGFDKHRMYFVSLLNYCFEKHKGILVYGEIQDKQIQKQMQYLGVELGLPLISKNELQGIIMLGKKYSGEAYSREDLDLLETLTNQTSIAIENSRLFNQVKDLSENLEKKVSEQTKNIKTLLNMKSELLNTISHQLRTPTSIFRGLLSMIDEKGEDKLQPEQREEFIQKSLGAADRLVVIINSINQANELQGQKIVLEFNSVDLDDLIQDAMILFKRTAKEKQIELKYIRPEQDLPKVMAHADYLESAIEKLIDNAVWYTKKHGKILITTKQENNNIKIIIQDTGIGLTQDDKKILFKKFSKGRGAKEINMNSSGLGLFIAKKIITAHKGEITAESQGKDKGSTFTITIPVMQGV